MRRICAAILASAALVVAPAAMGATASHAPSTPTATIAKHCGAGYTRARIGGAVKCLHGGEYCAKRYRKQYRQHGYTCRRTHGVWRLG